MQSIEDWGAVANEWWGSAGLGTTTNRRHGFTEDFIIVTQQDFVNQQDFVTKQEFVKEQEFVKQKEFVKQLES